MNAQINTLKSNDFQNAPNPATEKQNLQEAFSGFYPTMKRARIIVREFTNIAFQKIAGNQYGKNLFRLFLRNRLVNYFFKALLMLISFTNAILNRFVSRANALMIAMTDTFFKFMDDFFLMDEEAELIAIQAYDEKPKSPVVFQMDRVHTSKRLKINHHFMFNFSKNAVAHSNHTIKNASFKSMIKSRHFPEINLRSRDVKQYFRHTLNRTLNLFKPLLPKLPLNLNTITHQTPV